MERGRIGFVATPMILVYATGGLAVAHIRDTWNSFAPPVTTNDSTRAGWTFGGGVEYMLAPNWSLRLEGLFADFGSQVVNGPLSGVGPGPYRTGFAHSAAMARGGFNFRW